MSIKEEMMNFAQAKREYQLRHLIGDDHILTIAHYLTFISSYFYCFIIFVFIELVDMSNVVLTYFPMCARAEGIKLALNLARIPFTFKPVQNWPEEKAEGLKSGLLPFGQVPLLQIDDMNIVQSLAILNYISKK